MYNTKGMQLTAKDLHNFQQRLKEDSDDSLDTAITMLKNIYSKYYLSYKSIIGICISLYVYYRDIYSLNLDADVDLTWEEDNNNRKVFRGLYFSTPKMQAALKAWPGIVFIDTTYNLLKKKLISLIMCVQDSMGCTHIVAVALLANEQASTLKSIFNIFIKRNAEASQRIMCFMTDID